MENLEVLERQSTLDLKIPKVVAVVGCGGVGSWVAYFLALAGVKELWLFDDDEVSMSNLNRIPVSSSFVGVRKSRAVAQLIKSVRHDCEVLPFGKFTGTGVCDSTSIFDWIIATTDTWASRQMVNKWAVKHNIKYIEAAAEGEQGSATGQPAEWKTVDEENPGYASIPVWVGPCVFAAGIAVAHVLHNQDMCDRTIRLGWADTEFGEGFGIFDSTER